jgi:hypothetical protein
MGISQVFLRPAQPTAPTLESERDALTLLRQRTATTEDAT